MWKGISCLAVTVAFAAAACGGGSQSTGKGGSTGTGGQSGVGIDGSAGSDAPIGVDADHTVTTWPDFPPGMCAPTRPAVLDSPGVVDPEDLCHRRFQPDRIPIALGEWGYGSMGIIVSSDVDAAWPDTDFFVVTPGPGEGKVVRMTIETLSGDFQPLGWYSFGGGLGGGAADGVAGQLGTVRRELMWSGGALELMVLDGRAMTEGDTDGAGAVYRVRFDVVEKTPVDLGALPVLRTGDYTHDSIVGVYSFTVPPERGRLLLNVTTSTRPSGLPVSPVATQAMLFDPVGKKNVKVEIPYMKQDVVVGYEVNPQSPATTLAPGLYWLFVDTPGSVAKAARTDYDIAIEFKGTPANDKCASAIDATPAGTTTRMTMGDTTYANSDTALEDSFVSSACYQATLGFLPLVGRDVYYSVVVPSRKRLTATLTPTGTWHPALWMTTDCVAPEISCLAAKASTTSTAPQTVTWLNVAATDRTVYLIVDSAQDAGAFSLATSFTDGPTAPANDTCAGIIALDLSSGSASVSSATTEGATDDEHPGATSRSEACKDTSAHYNGADIVYSAVVPAGKRLSVTAFPSGQYNPALWISETCANPEPTCLAARDGDGTRENVVWTNTAMVDKPVVIHVDAQDPVGGAFSLSASVGAPKACPTTARDPAVAYVSRTNNAGNDFIFTPTNVSAACASAVTSPLIGDDDITAFDVPAGQTLSLTIKSTVTLNGAPVDRWVGLLTTACGTVTESGAACVAAGTSLSWKNNGSATQRVYLFMDLASRSPAQADYNVLPSLN
jgi:hypothetical protein